MITRVMGYIFVTRKQGGAHQTAKHSHPHGYTFIYPQTQRERNEEHDERAEQARAMREEGKSYRQIAEELGYKTPSAVHKLLKQGE